MKKVIIAGFLVVLAVVFGLFLRKTPLEREEVISNLDRAIAQAKESGEYHCCIEPPCKMCYLGNWIFEQGKCACDDMIAEGRFDQVCPECKHGTEKGQCESSDESCSVEI